MVVSMDNDDSINVHLIRKKEIAERLALLALRYNYGKGVNTDGPSPFKLEIN